MDGIEINKQLAEIYVDSLRNNNGGMFRYGMINNNIGYIQINAMFLQSDYNIPQNLGLMEYAGKYQEIQSKVQEEQQRDDEVAGINKMMDKAMAEMNRAEAYILDLRHNVGGKDGISMAVLNHFAQSEKIVFTKKSRVEDGFANIHRMKTIPTTNSFNGPVYVLTSHLTASASEILLLGTLPNSNFIKIGSRSEGIFSSTLEKSLPNGWEYSISNEVYMDLEGKSYENIGISPDYKLEYPRNRDAFFDLLLGDIKNKKDRAIDLVIELENRK